MLPTLFGVGKLQRGQAASSLACQCIPPAIGWRQPKNGVVAGARAQREALNVTPVPSKTDNDKNNLFVADTFTMPPVFFFQPPFQQYVPIPFGMTARPGCACCLSVENILSRCGKWPTAAKSNAYRQIVRARFMHITLQFPCQTLLDSLTNPFTARCQRAFWESGCVKKTGSTSGCFLNWMGGRENIIHVCFI